MLEFEKYSASGNDFLITDRFPSDLRGDVFARALCDRHLGIGADGLVIVHPHHQYAYQWEFYNSDGSKAAMCGNASRCVGLYAYLHALAPRKHCFLSGAGGIGVEVLQTSYPYWVRSNLGKYKVLGEFGEWSLFDTGVPHLIALLHSKEEFETFEIQTLQKLREQYDANVNIAYCDGEIYRIKTYERGVEGITLACGTGMASLVALLNERKVMQEKVWIVPPMNERLEFGLVEGEIFFQGRVSRIARCHINLQDFGNI
ncbi:diaminopimelate epimerase [Helicobacter pametensis]|uniref:diaminopimelate epimerase n=1 Tax=Helicobacter pametensis TaxID=95149 RepID=UPI0004B8DC0E|nr:diaminopimelate epimerase [Helicobacter pametensis]